MTTQFKLLVDLVGLSLGEAATFLEVRPDTTKAWSKGKNRTPETVIAELIGLYDRMVRSADEACTQIEKLVEKHGAPETIDLSITGEWPTEGVRDRVAAMVIAEFPDLDFTY